MANKATIRQKKYDATHRVSYLLKFNIENDRDVIEWLNRQSNKQGAIKQVIREYILREQIRAEMTSGKIE